MKDRETPLKLVRLWSKMAPGIYEALDHLHSLNGQADLHWPDYCVLPIGAAFTCLTKQHGLTDNQAAQVAAELIACWTWRQNKVIYAFDVDFAATLAAQAEDIADTDQLPTELLYRLPYPCIYIKANIFDQFDGFWCWIEHDLNTNRAEFRIQWVDVSMEKSFSVVLHLIPGATLADCVIDTVKESLSHRKLDIRPATIEMDDNLRQEAIEMILKPMQLVLYLLAERAEVDERPKVVVKKEKNGVRIVQDKAGEIREYDVGIRIGSAIRQYRMASQDKPAVSGTGSAKRPHSRRGHWHHYWTGPKTGDRKLVLRWTAPTFIHSELGKSDNEIVVFPVKGGE